MNIPLLSRSPEALKCPHDRIFGSGCPTCATEVSPFAPPTTEQAFRVQPWARMETSIEEGSMANDNRPEKQ